MKLYHMITALCLLPMPASADSLTVVTDILPVHSLVSQVMGDQGEVHVLTNGLASPHHQALRPSQARLIGQADVIIRVGGILTPWLDDAIQANAPDTPQLLLLEVEGTQLLDARIEHDHGSEVAHDDHTEEHADDHVIDPHAWLDTDNAAIWLTAIGQFLAQTDPKGAAAYLENASQGMELDRHSPATLSDRPRHVVFHDAYQYYEARLGMPAPLIISTTDAVAPGAAHLAEVRQDLLSGTHRCIFVEPGTNLDLLRRLSEGTDVRIVEVDPLGAKLTPGPDLYPQLMQNVAQSFESCP